MKYEHVNDVSKLKQLLQEKRQIIQRKQAEIEQIELKIKQIQFEKEHQLKMTI